MSSGQNSGRQYRRYLYLSSLYPDCSQTLKEQGTPEIRIATVTNFPHGNDDIDIALAETRAAIAYGADEVDVVFPYRALMAGNEQVGFDLVKACKEACAAANVLLKVIIETGELKDEALIRKASEISIKAGADFIKTSTGKVAVNATPESARIMMEVIRDMGVEKPLVSNRRAACVLRKMRRNISPSQMNCSALTGLMRVTTALALPACWQAC